MAVRIRLSRIGRRNRPFYRLGAFDSRSPRNGKCLEYLGWYNPIEEKPENILNVKLDRVEHWLSVGAEVTPKTRPLLKKAGVKFPTKGGEAGEGQPKQKPLKGKAKARAEKAKSLKQKAKKKK